MVSCTKLFKRSPNLLKRLVHTLDKPTVQIIIRLGLIYGCMNLIPFVPEHPNYWDEVAVVGLYLLTLLLCYDLVRKVL